LAYILSNGQRRSRDAACFAEACAKFREIRRFAPGRMLWLRCPRLMPRVLVQFGELRGLIYATDRGRPGMGRTYIHFMERPPLLACNSRGDQLYVLGGDYRITRRGIEG
jgi:hypothetical protein